MPEIKWIKNPDTIILSILEAQKLVLKELDGPDRKVVIKVDDHFALMNDQLVL